MNLILNGDGYMNPVPGRAQVQTFALTRVISPDWHATNKTEILRTQRESSVNQTERDSGKPRYVSREQTVGNRRSRVGDETT